MRSTSTTFFGCFQGNQLFSNLSPSPVDEAMAALLREYNKDADADALLRGELNGLDLGNLGGDHYGGHYGRISVAEIGVLADWLKHNRTLSRLRLCFNHLHLSHVNLIANALKSNNTLVALDLSNNSLLNNDSLLAIIDALKFNVRIQVIDLDVRYESHSHLTMIYDLTRKRNKYLIPRAVRRAALLLIGIRLSNDFEGMGAFAVCPKEIVKMISMEVWATRMDLNWIDAVTIP